MAVRNKLEGVPQIAIDAEVQKLADVMDRNRYLGGGLFSKEGDRIYREHLRKSGKK